MSESEFWDLIAEINESDLVNPSTVRSVLEPFIKRLTLLDRDQLESFQDHLAQALFRLDGKKFAEASKSGDSNDGFLYARAFVVAKGQKFYKCVLANPELMPKEYEECEELLYAVEHAWQLKDEDEWSYITPVSYETGSNTDAWV